MSELDVFGSSIASASSFTQKEKRSHSTLKTKYDASWEFAVVTFGTIFTVYMFDQRREADIFQYFAIYLVIGLPLMYLQVNTLNFI